MTNNEIKNLVSIAFFSIEASAPDEPLHSDILSNDIITYSNNSQKSITASYRCIHRVA